MTVSDPTGWIIIIIIIGKVGAEVKNGRRKQTVEHRPTSFFVFRDGGFIALVMYIFAAKEKGEAVFKSGSWVEGIGRVPG